MAILTITDTGEIASNAQTPEQALRLAQVALAVAQQLIAAAQQAQQSQQSQRETAEGTDEPDQER